MTLTLIIAFLISFGYINDTSDYNNLNSYEQEALIEIIEDDLETI